MKKLKAFFMLTVIVFSLVACKSTEESGNNLMNIENPSEKEKNIELTSLDEETAWNLVEIEHQASSEIYYTLSDDELLDDSDVYTFYLGDGITAVDCLSAKGIDTEEDLKDYLSKYFTDEYIDREFMKEYDYRIGLTERNDFQSDDEGIVHGGNWFKANGTIYFEPNHGHGFEYMWRDTLDITEIHEGLYRVICHGGIPESYRDDDRYCPSHYIVVWDEDGYKIADMVNDRYLR